MSSHKRTSCEYFFDQYSAPANIIGNSVLSPWAIVCEQIITFPESVQCLCCSLAIISSRLGDDYDNDDNSNNSQLTLTRSVPLHPLMVAELLN